MLSYFIQSFPFRITVVFEKSGFTHSKNTNHINQLAEFTLYLQGLMTDRKVPHISENQRHGEDNAKSSYVPSPSCQTFSWFKPPLVLFPLSLHDASPSPSYHHSSSPPPPHSSTLITRPPCLLHVEVLEDPEGGSHGLPPPHQTSEIFYCWSDNILATTRSHITPQMADLAGGSGE